jgi:hypothetical protein
MIALDLSVKQYRQTEAHAMYEYILCIHVALGRLNSDFPDEGFLWMFSVPWRLL